MQAVNSQCHRDGSCRPGSRPTPLATATPSPAKSLADRGLSFDLCVLARQLPVALDLVRKCPRTSFVLDHCGVPDVKARDLDPWRQHLAELARESNVVACNVSGLVAYADPQQWTVEDLRPFVEHTH